MLRSELMHNHEQENKLIDATYIMIAAIWGTAITVGNQWLVFVSIILLVPLSLRIADIRYSIAFISSYMIVYLEDADVCNINWESRRHNYYIRNKQSILYLFIHTFARMDFVFISIASVSLFWILDKTSLYKTNILCFYLVVFIQLLLIGLEIFLCIYFSNTNHLQKKLIQKWSALKENT